jgi:PAS domain S-box-containing protein
MSNGAQQNEIDVWQGVTKSGVILQLADGSIRACNPIAEEILGYKLVEMQGWTSEAPWQAFHEDGSPFPGETHPTMVTLRSGQPCTNVVMGLRQPDGRLVWLLIDTQPLFLANQTAPYAAIANFADITPVKTVTSSHPISVLETKLVPPPPEVQCSASAALRQNVVPLLENMSDGFFTCDRTWRFTYVNREAERIFARPREVLLGHVVWEEFPESVNTEIYGHYHRAIREQVKVEFESYYLPFARWFEIAAYPSEQGLAVYFRDITDRKQIAAALQQQEALLRLVFDSIPDTVVLYDADRRFQLVNPAGLARSGRSLEDLVGQRDEEVWPPAVTQGYLPALIKAIETRTPQTLEHSFSLPETGDFTLLIKYVPLLDDQGAVQQILAFTVDVSLRKQIENQIRKLNNDLEKRVIERTADLVDAYREVQLVSSRLTGIIEGSRDLIAAVDLNFCLITFNNAYQQEFKEVFGVDLAVGMNLLEAIAHLPAEQAKVAELWERALQGEEFTIEQEFGDATLKRTYYEITFSAIRDTQQTLIGASQIVRDVTQRREFEATLKHLNEDLEQRVAQRTVELNATNQQLLAEIRDRQLAEAELQLTAKHLNFALRSAPITLYNQDLDLRYTWMHNPRHAFEVAEIIGKRDEDLICAESAAILTQLKQQVLETRVGIRQEVRLFLADQPYYYDLTIEPLWNEQQELIGISGAAVEITELKQVEEALHQSNAVLNAINQFTPTLIYVKDCQGRIVLANPALMEMVNLPEADVIGRTSLEFHQPREAAEAIMENDRRVLETRQTYEFEELLDTPAGQRCFLSVKAPYLDEQGNTVGLIGISTEITERKRTEALLESHRMELQQQLAEIEAIYQSSPIGLSVLSTDFRFLRINQRLAEMNGPPVAAHLGRTVREVLPNLADAAEQVLQTIVQTGEPLLNVEIRGETPAQPGIERVWLEHFLPLKDDRGEVIGISVVCEEVTKRKRAEQEREELLQREQLARSQAEQANRVKDEFLAVLSHELRTPLNPILGWSKLLQSSKFNEEKTRQALATIERNAKLQVQLIDDLLDISRILRGKLSLNLEPVSLAPVISAALDTVRLAADAKQIVLAVDLDPQVGSVQGDAGRLQQIVWNLLSNAIKFTPPEGRVTVRLTVGQGTWDADNLEGSNDTLPPALSSLPSAQITVSDTGKGINPEFLPHIFEYFRQEDSSITRQFGGLGLGLAISRQLVEAHGGTIAVTASTPGAGTTFTVCLPILPAPPEQSVEDASDAFDLTHLRILLVDDEADSLTLLETIISAADGQVTAVSSAQAALQALATQPIDLLISDIGMPGMNGYELIQQVRATIPNAQQLPAIALTAYASDEDRQRALLAGYQLHLSKPIDPQRLLTAIVQLCPTTANHDG